MIDLDRTTLETVAGGECWGLSIVYGDGNLCIGVRIK